MSPLAAPCSCPCCFYLATENGKLTYVILFYLRKCSIDQLDSRNAAPLDYDRTAAAAGRKIHISFSIKVVNV
jgi:uncharacterized membrane protein